ncbi:MAG: SDR family NAD(P)-dependent oxidoreductase [Gammaproteobacteria bacterium]|nr:SDR family NAD(P)-dependent oxidoreductase [Gammaproteobacteria bacterium]
MKQPYTISALITGGASGLGLATARHIIELGGCVTLLDVNKNIGNQISKQLGEKTLFIETDVTSEAAVDAALLRATNTFGKINLALNCAGVAPSERVLSKTGLMSTSSFARTIAINLISTFCVCRAAVNVMQHNEPDTEGQRGIIINTASIAAYDGQIGQAAYAASKGGIASMTLPLAREFSRLGIRVVTIAPGLFKTPLFDTLPPNATEALTANIPFPKRAGDPHEFAQLVLHIYHNTMLNGETIRLDGALRM